MRLWPTTQAPGRAELRPRGREDQHRRLRSALGEGLHAAVGCRDDQGGYLVTLDPRARDRLKERRRPSETYSQVILRLAKG